MKTAIIVILTLVAPTFACVGAPPPNLEGREFILLSLTADGAAQPLVPGTQIRLSFADGQIGANAGCNHIGGRYSIEGGRLVVGELGMTEMGCDPDRHQQDERLVNFLAANPALQLEGERLVLEGGGVVATLLDRQSVEPDAPLVGTTWTLSSIIEGETVRSVPAEVVSTLRFSEDGSVAADPGCNSGGGRYELGDGVIAFGPIALTRMACPGAPDEIEAAVLPVLAGEVEYEIDHGTLTLRAGEHGLQYRAG